LKWKFAKKMPVYGKRRGIPEIEYVPVVAGTYSID
jgi:hypothetical protein